MTDYQRVRELFFESDLAHFELMGRKITEDVMNTAEAAAAGCALDRIREALLEKLRQVNGKGHL